MAQKRKALPDLDRPWAVEELALLAGVAGSPLHEPLSRVFTAYRNLSQEALLDPATDHDRTQYHRGRLSLLADLVLLLEQEAKAEYLRLRNQQREPPA